MKFPGSRIAQHYFPVVRKATRVDPAAAVRRFGLVGLDQVLVDLEVHAPLSFARDAGVVPGESVFLSQENCQRVLERIQREGIRVSYAAGGTVANTLNNFVHLSGEPAVLLGAIEDSIPVGSPAFYFVAQTPRAMELDRLKPVRGSIGTAITFISPDGDRSFAVAPGVSNDYGPEDLPEDVIQNASVVVASLYGLRDPAWPIARATHRLLEIAGEAKVPVAFGLGTSSLVRDKRSELMQLLERHVSIAAMNAQEAAALCEEQDVLKACERILDLVDLVIITEGPEGLTMAGYTDEGQRRETDQKVRSKSIADYNRWEYSRLMRRSDCDRPQKIYSHIHPYRGGPERLSNTSGAGDAALAAVLHDVAANRYHRQMVPDSGKHPEGVRFLTYSSLSRCAQYGNRVAYEVLRGQSPRLDGPVGSDEPDKP